MALGKALLALFQCHLESGFQARSEESLQSEAMVDSQSCAGGFPLNWTTDVPGAVAPGVLDAMFPCVKAWSLQILCLLPQLAVRRLARKPGG